MHILRSAGGEVAEWYFGGQRHRPSASNWCGVYQLVGSIQLTSPTWWRSQYLQNSSGTRLRMLSTTLEEELKVLVFVLRLNSYYFVCSTVFLCFSVFSLLWLSLCFWTWGRPRRLKLFYKQEVGGRGAVEGVCPREGPAESCLVSVSTPWIWLRDTLIPLILVLDIFIWIFRKHFWGKYIFAFLNNTISLTANIYGNVYAYIIFDCAKWGLPENKWHFPWNELCITWFSVCVCVCVFLFKNCVY